MEKNPGEIMELRPVAASKNFRFALCFLMFASHGVPSLQAQVSGRVMLGPGEIPNPDKVVDVSRFAHCQGLGEITTTNWQVSPERGLAGVVIWTDASSEKPSQETVRIIKKNCQFSRKAVGIRPGTTVQFENQDESLHNVRGILHAHGKLGRNLFNLGLPRKGDVKEWTFDSPGIYRVECDIHRWLVCWIVVNESPSITVSDANGSFELNPAPNDNAQITLWHPQFQDPLQVTLKPGQKSIEVTFDPRKASPALP